MFYTSSVTPCVSDSIPLSNKNDSVKILLVLNFKKFLLIFSIKTVLKMYIKLLQLMIYHHQIHAEEIASVVVPLRQSGVWFNFLSTVFCSFYSNFDIFQFLVRWTQRRSID